MFERGVIVLDYLEGLLLGRLWSDTDFENRKHFGLFVIYGLLVDAIVLYLYISGKGLLNFGIIGPIHIAVFTLLFLALPRLSVQVDDLQDFLMTYLNGTLEKYTEKFQASAGSFSTVLGVLAGGVHVVGTVLLYALAAIIIPGLIYLAIRLVQYVWDWVVNTLIIKRFFPQRK